MPRQERNKLRKKGFTFSFSQSYRKKFVLYSTNEARLSQKMEETQFDIFLKHLTALCFLTSLFKALILGQTIVHLRDLGLAQLLLFDAVESMLAGWIAAEHFLDGGSVDVAAGNLRVLVALALLDVGHLKLTRIHD